MTFSSGAVRGPCFFFVHARVPFKRGNLRKGTPSHRSQDLYLWGRWAGGSNHGTPSMKTAWLIMGTFWVVQSTQWWHLVTHVSVLIDFNPWNIRTVPPTLFFFGVVVGLLIFWGSTACVLMKASTNSKQVALIFLNAFQSFLTSTRIELRIN